MNRTRSSLLAAASLLIGSIAINASGHADTQEFPSSWVSGGIAAFEVVDRTSGNSLSVHPWRRDFFVVGTPGNEYRLRIRNLTGERILAVASVDGVNIVSGESASPTQSGYVLGPWQTLDIDGWRTSLEKTAAFYFTDLGNSYAARTGRPIDVGVIGVAVFRERHPVVEYQSSPMMRDQSRSAPEAAAPAAAGRTDKKLEQSNQSSPMARGATKPAPLLGTGYGRNETSYAQRVAFERATSAPTDVLAIRYDRRDNLLAMGVLTRLRVIGRAPDPFPGSFVAPPPY